METVAEKDAHFGEPSAALVETGSGSSGSSLQTRPTAEGGNGITILNEATNLKDTAYAFSTKKKWWILTVVALCQTSMSKLLRTPISIPSPSLLHTKMDRDTKYS